MRLRTKAKRAADFLDAFSTLPGKSLSHYQVLQQIGEGGRSSVYQARDMRLQRFVALKVLPPWIAVDAASKARFLQEARVLSQLNSPNIVTVYDVGHDRGVDFIVMEYLQGQALDRRLASGGLVADVCLQYALQITAGLTKAHGAGIVHRDLKPSNIFVTDEDGCKLLDFGMAEPLPPPWQGVRFGSEPGSSMIAGTYGYMSPEQVRGERVDERSDLFSFGGLLYEMLSGRRAFAGGSAIETLRAVLEDAVPALGQDVPSDLASIVYRCLEKDPSARFQSATELEQALENTKIAMVLSQASKKPRKRSTEAGSETPKCARSIRARRVVTFAGTAIVAVVGFKLWEDHGRGDPQDAFTRFDGGIAEVSRVDASGCLSGSAGSCDAAAAVASLKRAIGDFSEVLRTHPDHLGSFWNRGLAYAKLCKLQSRLDRSQATGACDAAISDFGEALKSHPPDPSFKSLPDPADVHWNRGLTHWSRADLDSNIGRKIAHLTSAIQDFNQILNGGAQFTAFLKKKRAEVTKSLATATNQRDALLAKTAAGEARK
jgi:serine/threonine protein kinase